MQDITLTLIHESKTNPLCGETRYVAFGLEPFPLGDWRLRQTLALP
jgi:hypothetical protein